MNKIAITNIKKCYSKNTLIALNDVSFNVQQGELFGLIGPDGAGKTSLFRIIATLLLPDAGEVTIGKYDVVKHYKHIRHKIGYMPGKFSLYQDLSVEENLNFFAAIFNTSIANNYNMLKDIYGQIEPFKKRRAGKLSGGMKQKLALCCAMIHCPEVLLLDEPTTGVDAVSRKEFWDMLKKLQKQGMTILVSTPYMDEANLCERIALIQGGEILSIETPLKITEAYPDALYAIQSNNMNKLLIDLKKNKHIKSVFSFGDAHHITFNEPSDMGITATLDHLKKEGHASLQCKPISPNIEDCFIHLMSQSNAHQS